MDQLKKLLQTPLNTDNGNELAKQLAEVEAWQSLVSVEYREAEAKLSDMKGRTFDTTLSSEDKRKIAMIAACVKEQQVVDELADLADIIQRRISLGQTLLKNFSTEMRSGLR